MKILQNHWNVAEKYFCVRPIVRPVIFYKICENWTSVRKVSRQGSLSLNKELYQKYFMCISFLLDPTEKKLGQSFFSSGQYFGGYQ